MSQLLDLLMGYLPLLSQAGENGAEYVTLFQSLVRTGHWRYYLAVRGILPLIGDLMNEEIELISHLEETTLNSDLSQGR